MKSVILNDTNNIQLNRMLEKDSQGAFSFL